MFRRTLAEINDNEVVTIKIMLNVGQRAAAGLYYSFTTKTRHLYAALRSSRADTKIQVDIILDPLYFWVTNKQIQETEIFRTIWNSLFLQIPQIQGTYLTKDIGIGRHSKLWPSIDNLAIVYLLLTRPPLDWRSLCYQTKLLQSGGGRASNK